MKRIIKFRAKRKNGNDWVYGCYQHLVIHGEMRHFIAPSNSLLFDDIKFIDALIEVDENTICQYWRSVNKSDLYDGDIFAFNGAYRKIVRYKEDESCFCVASISHLECEDILDIWNAPSDIWWKECAVLMEVIGNEFDNPELLNLYE